MIVRVYRNLNKRCFSVKAKDAAGHWKVVGYEDSIAIKNAKFVVQEGGRKRVLKDKQKNVHAFVEGERFKTTRRDLGREISYNPYTTACFHYVDNNSQVNELPAVWLSDGRVFELPA